MSNALKTSANAVGFNSPIEPSRDVEFVNENGKTGKQVDGVLRTIGLIRAPQYVNVKFGNVMNWEKCYITSMATTFSNVLDYRGFPLSAKCTLTITPEKYPVAEDMLQVYNTNNSLRRKLRRRL